MPEELRRLTPGIGAFRRGNASPELAAALNNVGQALLDGKVYADAELLLREVLSFGEKTAATYWATHNSRSRLGGALVGQEKYAAAEPLLLQGYAGLKERAATIPDEFKGSPTQALDRLVQLYAAWGKPAEAAKWRTELEAHRKAAENSVKPKEK